MVPLLAAPSTREPSGRAVKRPLNAAWGPPASADRAEASMIFQDWVAMILPGRAYSELNSAYCVAVKPIEVRLDM